MAVAVGKGIDYSLVLHDSQKLWVASSRLNNYFKDAEILDSCSGADLVGLRYKALFHFSDELASPEELEKRYQIYDADFVSTEDGTGAVHIAPSFGEEDFQLGAKLGLGLFRSEERRVGKECRCRWWRGQ